MSHFAHLYTVVFLWLRDEQIRQQSCFDFTGHCWLWRLLSCTIFAADALGLPTKLGVGRSWLFPASSIKLLTRRSLKSRWVHWAPHEDNRIQLLSTVRSRRWKNSFEVTSIHRIAVGNTIWNVNETRVPVILFHDVRLHGAVAVVTKISFCWWWVHVSQHVNFSSVLPN